MVNKYYQEHKRKAAKQNVSEQETDKRWKKTQERYQILLKKKKEKRCQYNQERKQKLHDYRRNYYLKHKK